MSIIYKREDPSKTRANGKSSPYWIRNVSYYNSKGQKKSRDMRVQDDNHNRFKAKYLQNATIAKDQETAYAMIRTRINAKRKSKKEKKQEEPPKKFKFIKERPKLMKKYTKRVRNEDGTYTTKLLCEEPGIQSLTNQ